MIDPIGYEKTKGGVGSVAKNVFATFFEKMKWDKQEIYLDFGCGAGSNLFAHVLPLARKYDSQIHAVDISQVAIDYAKIHCSSPEIDYFVGDIMQIGILPKEIQYNKIFSYNVLHWIKDTSGILQQFYDILKPGGYIGATVITRGPQFSLLECLGRSEKWGEFMEGYEAYIPRWIEENVDPVQWFKMRLEQCGFEILSVDSLPPESFKGLDSLVDLLIAMNPFLDRVNSSELRMSLREDSINFLQKSADCRHSRFSFIARKP